MSDQWIKHGLIFLGGTQLFIFKIKNSFLAEELRKKFFYHKKKIIFLV